MRLTPIEVTPLADEVAISEEEILADLLYPAPPAPGGVAVRSDS